MACFSEATGKSWQRNDVPMQPLPKDTFRTPLLVLVAHIQRIVPRRGETYLFLCTSVPIAYICSHADVLQFMCNMHKSRSVFRRFWLSENKQFLSKQNNPMGNLLDDDWVAKLENIKYSDPLNRRISLHLSFSNSNSNCSTS